MVKLNADIKAGTDAATVTDVQVTSSSQTIIKPIVKCWCFLCHVELVEEKEKFGMHGEIVCPECYDDNIYQAL